MEQLTPLRGARQAAAGGTARQGPGGRWPGRRQASPGRRGARCGQGLGGEGPAGRAARPRCRSERSARNTWATHLFRPPVPLWSFRNLTRRFDRALTAAGEASPGLRARQTLSVFPVPLQGSLPSVCLSVRFTVLNLLSVQFRALLCSLPAASQRFPRSGLVFSSDFPWLSVRMLPGNGVMLRAVSLRGCVCGGEHLGCCQHPAINTREIWRTVSGSQTT